LEIKSVKVGPKKILMTDYAQITTLDEELEWEEWKGVRDSGVVVFILS